jgi:hypothetical protein
MTPPQKENVPSQAFALIRPPPCLAIPVSNP